MSTETPNGPSIVQRRLRDRATFNLALMFATAILHGVPWLIEGWLAMVMGWCGIACGLVLASSRSPFGRLWCMWLWASLAIGIAFHWSPAAMAYTLSSDYWLGLVVAMPLILWDGLRLALGYWLAARLTSNLYVVWFPTALTTILLEEFMPGVFPWRLGLLQLDWPWWVQAVDVFGSSWSTLVAFAVAGLILQIGILVSTRFQATNTLALPDLATASSYPAHWLMRCSIWLLLVNVAYSTWAWSHWQHAIGLAPNVRMGLIQVDPSYKESLQQLQALTRQTAPNVDLILWPESSGGTYDLALDELCDDQRNFQLSRAPERGLRPWPNPKCELLLAGKNYREPIFHAVKSSVLSADDPKGQLPLEEVEPECLHVSAMLLDDQERIVARYHKRHLMPFGEYVPGEKSIPGMAELFDMGEHITPGTGSAVLSSATGARIGVMLCYEDMVPSAARNAVAEQANVIVSLINGSAFASPYTLRQHRMLSHMRAIENRRCFVRCSATGQSCVISALGELTACLPLQENGVLKATVPLLTQASFSSRIPPLLPWFALLLPIALALQSMTKMKVSSWLVLMTKAPRRTFTDALAGGFIKP